MRKLNLLKYIKFELDNHTKKKESFISELKSEPMKLKENFTKEEINNLFKHKP